VHHIIANLSYVGNSAVVLWRKGANCNFFGGTAKIFCGRKELELSASRRIEFLVLFVQEKRTVKSNLLFE
jgi:hypothetical protein